VIEPRCFCDAPGGVAGPSTLSLPERRDRFIADLLAHGAVARPVDPLALRASLAHTADDGSNPFAKRKR
jgi:hypothetical protein